MSKKKEDGCSPASYVDMLRYAKKFDYFLLVIGLLFSITNGALHPFGCLIFRGITNVLMKGQAEYNEGKFDVDQFTTDLLVYIQYYFYLGVTAFILEYTAMASFFTLCERQIYQIRQKYLSSVLRQDIPWFDNNEVGKLTQKMSSGIDRIQAGSSDKIVVLLKASACLISGVSIGFYLSWQMSTIMIFIVPFVILTIWGSARVSHFHANIIILCF
jgi:ATP-binding cassette subfamily B (MDR/TAP) protein 1